MDNQRLAALKVSGLSQKDRKWVLKNLDKEERQIILTHIDELEQIGKRYRNRFSDLINSTELEQVFNASSRNDLQSIEHIESDHEPKDSKIAIQNWLENSSGDEIEKVLDSCPTIFIAIYATMYVQVLDCYINARCGTERALRIKSQMSKIELPLPEQLVYAAESILLRRLKRGYSVPEAASG